MTRATKGVRFISTADLYKRITNATGASSFKSEHSHAMLTRFGMPARSSADFLLLDVRSCIEIERTGLILGAQVLPSYHIYYALTQPAEKLSEMFGFAHPEKGQQIICYADNGPRIHVAHTTLSYLGYRNLFLYQEGIEGFRKEYPYLIGRLPVEEEKQSSADSARSRDSGGHEI